MRLTKIVRFRTMRIKGTFDIYNVFNANTILAVNATYGPSWLRPATNLAGRLLKFGAQFDF